MFRYLILPTLVALLLVPDWASAFFRRRQAPCPVAPAQKVQYTYAPAYPPCPPMFLPPPVACCPPAVAVAPTTTKSTTPQVVPERMATPKAVTPETPTPTVPKVEKLIEPVQPRLVPNQESNLPESPVKPVVPVAAVEPVKPVVPVEEFKLPPIDVPATPPALPKLSFDPAPVKDAVPQQAKTPAVKPDVALPKMELPSFDTPAPPTLAMPKEVEVKSSPIHAEKNSPAYELFPVDGAVPGNPNEKRIVTFYNFSGRDLLLTIDGKMTTLPAKHTIEGKLGSQFKMQIGVGEEYDLKVPAAGAEIVLKK